MTRLQERCSSENCFSEDIRISHIRKDPKKARQQADQNTLLLSEDQELFAISCPSIFSSGSVIISLALLAMFSYRAKFSAPLSIDLMKKSLKIFVSKPRRL